MLVNYQGSVIAFGDPFGLHARATVGAATTERANVSIGAHATSQLVDFLRPLGTLPPLVRTTIRVTTHGAGDGFTQLDVSDAVTTGDECFFHNGGSCTVSILSDPSLGISLSLLLDAAAQCAGLLAGGCQGASNFLNTSFISAISFSDVNGNPLHLGFASDSGLAYPMPQIPVTEPATLLLVAIGVATIRRRGLIDIERVGKRPRHAT
jgi:hypothetical protein